MAKDKIAYVCENCGQESPKWIGKCPACGKWNTFKEIRVADTRQQAATSAAASTGHQLRKNKILRLHEISAADDPRIDMHDGELNRVLGEVDWFLAPSSCWAASLASGSQRFRCRQPCKCRE